MSSYQNDVKLCLSTWFTLWPNMAERCRHKKCHLCFVYALLVHPLVWHMPNMGDLKKMHPKCDIGGQISKLLYHYLLPGVTTYVITLIS